MGEAKRRRQRLGDLYGQPITPEPNQVDEIARIEQSLTDHAARLTILCAAEILAAGSLTEEEYHQYSVEGSDHCLVIYEPGKRCRIANKEERRRWENSRCCKESGVQEQELTLADILDWLLEIDLMSPDDEDSISWADITRFTGDLSDWTM